MNAGEPFLGRFREFVRRSRLIDRGERIVVAVSGGSDSMALLDLLDRFREEFQLTLSVAHFNHGLRGDDSDRDEALVRSTAYARGLECYVERADTRAVSEARKRSIEETGRELRYEFLSMLRSSLGFQKIATAHQADDNAETILFNLFRGAGVHGLSGIPVFRRDLCVIRPLLFATKEEILEYASRKGLVYREDASNASRAYTRNFFRHEVLPMIRQNVNPNIIATLRRTGELFDQLEEYLDEAANRAIPALNLTEASGTVVFDLDRFMERPIFLREHLLLRLARKFTSREIDFGMVKTMLRIAEGETGSSCAIAKDVVFYRNRGQLIFKRISNLVHYRHTIEPNRNYEFEHFCFGSASASGAVPLTQHDPNTEFIDADTLGTECVLRSWNDGDWFIPLGMSDRKKLSDFFIDEKIPLFEKLTIPLLVSDGEIVWVCGKRLDDRHKITAATQRVLKLQYAPRSHVLNE